MKNLVFASALLTASVLSLPAFAQDAAANLANADPACVMTNADGTKTLDTVKCKDGKPLADASTTGATPAPDAAQTSASPAMNTMPVIVSPEMLTNATIMSASDFMGKRVYSTDGSDIGEVNDFFVTNDGKVQGVVIGVGGFLGIGEKDVVVSMPSVQMQAADGGAKLVINATKEELNAAPSYDRTKRVYVQ